MFITSIYILLRLSNYIYYIIYLFLLSIPAQPPLLYTKKIILSIHILKFFCKHIMNIIIFILISFSSLYFPLFFISLIYISQFFLNFFLKITKNFVKPLDKMEKVCYNIYRKDLKTCLY